MATPKSVQFDGESFYLANQQGDGVKTDRATEYVRKGEDINGKWIKLVAVREYPDQKDAKAYAGSLIKIHKKNYPSYSRSLDEKADGSEALVSFLTARGEITQMEIFRIVKKNGHVVAYQYACRSYGDNTGELQAAVKRVALLLRAMTKFNPVS